MPLPDSNATRCCAACIWCCDNDKAARPETHDKGGGKPRTGRGGLEKKKCKSLCVVPLTHTPW